MGWSLQSAWNPTRVLQIAGSVDSSTGATEVITDLGSAYIKPLGNRQGPHVLATDWVGTHLAKWFGLQTFDVAIVSLHSDLVFHLPRGAVATPGPAFAARAMAGAPWNRQPRELEVLDNPEDITRLVVFDTWTLNCDRHGPRPLLHRLRRGPVSPTGAHRKGQSPRSLRAFSGVSSEASAGYNAGLHGATSGNGSRDSFCHGGHRTDGVGRFRGCSGSMEPVDSSSRELCR